MKKYVLALVILGMAFSVYASTDPNYTDNLNLWKPDADNRTAALPDANSNWETLDNAFDGDQGFASLLVDPTRQAGAYSGFLNVIDGGSRVLPAVGNMTGGAAEKTYGLYMLINRPNTADGTGDSEDAIIKGVYYNHGQNDSSFIARGLNLTAANGTTGILGLLGNQLGTLNRGTATSLYGLQIITENYDSITAPTTVVGLDVDLRNEGIDATTTDIGVYIHNSNNSTSDAVDNAILVSDAGTNTGFNYGIHLGGATINTADLVFGNDDVLYDSLTDGLVLTPVGRGTGDYTGVLHIDDGGDKDTPLTGIFTGGAAQKSYGVYLELNRPSTSDATGDSEDALIKGVYCNHGQNDSSFIARGINTHVGNRFGGTLGTVDNQIGSSTRGSYTTLRGLSVVAEDYYGITAGAEFGGIDVTLKCEGVDPTTTEYGLRIRNLDNSTANSIDDAISVSDSGTNTGFTNVINASGATVGQAQIVFSNGAKLFVGSANGENAVYAEVGAYDAAGSIYISSVGKIYVQVANAGANTDWETVTSASAE